MIETETSTVFYNSVMGNDAGFKFMTGYEITEIVHRRIFNEIFKIIQKYDSDNMISMISVSTRLAGLLTYTRAFNIVNPPLRLNAVLGKMYGIDVMIHSSNNIEKIDYIQVYYSNKWVRKTKINQIYDDYYGEKILDKIFIDEKLLQYI